MFQAFIEQARAIIQRLHASAEQGRDSIPEAMKVRLSELEAWDTSTQRIVAALFGAGSAEAARWRALAERRGALVGEAMRKDIKRGEYLGLIDYFHLAIGALLELGALYQHRLHAPAAVTPHPEAQEQRAAAEERVEQPLPAQGPVPLLPQAPPDDRPHVARMADGCWELRISVSDDSYQWLNDVAAARGPALARDGAAVTQLASTIIERVVANSRRGGRSG